MSTHFYAFGSICRGETDAASDVDLLACVSGTNAPLDRNKFSIYTYDRITQLFSDGNPFAWHLHFESRLLFSSDGTDFLAELGVPCPYQKVAEDCAKFRKLFVESNQSLNSSRNSAVFHLSCMFLATRNFATCYSFLAGRPIFSRKSPMLVEPRLPIADAVFSVLARARILSTRGYGSLIDESDVAAVRAAAPSILGWMNDLSVSGGLT